MAKRLQNNDVIGLVGTSASEWIQEIQAGETTHAIAVKHGIKFFNGSQDNTGVEWDGVQDLEVIIPTLADIVTGPVVLKGVINDPATDTPSNPQDGYLVYIGTNCTFANQACEAGDMAVYYNNAWHVISGENQITINAADASVSNNDNLFSITGTAKTLLSVEGKTLSVALDYGDVADNMKVVKGGLENQPIANGTVDVDGMSIALTYTSSSSQDVATGMSIALPTSLASGAVTISGNVLEASNFTFTEGSFPTVSKNAASISIDASTNISVEGTFVTSVSAVGSATLVAAAQADTDKIAFATGLAAASGTEFITNVRVYDSTKDEGKTPAFEIPGAVAVTGTSTFVTGLSTTAAASGDVVTSVAVGAVTIDASGSGIVTGLSKGGSAVVTSVSIGSAIKDTEAQWFYDGLTEGSDVVTDVTVGAVTLVANNNGGSPAIVSASVNASHVLVFNTSNFQTPVSISQANSTISKKGFSLGGVKLSGFDSASDTLTFGGISQAATTVSFKDFVTGSINVSLGSATQYFIDKAEDHAYTAEMGYAKISVTDASVSTGSPSLTNTGITAAIPADKVVVALSGGTLPSFSVDTATGTLTGSVGTALSTSEVSWLAVNPDKRNVAVGSYALTSDSAAQNIVGSAITVAAADTYELDNATFTIASGTFITSIEVDGTEVSVKPNA